jgi:hypothetical protein
MTTDDISSLFKIKVSTQTNSCLAKQFYQYNDYPYYSSKEKGDKSILVNPVIGVHSFDS